MIQKRVYQSEKRRAQAATTRRAILQAFADQLLQSGGDTLSPSEAAKSVGVSVRTVHTHFPNHESQLVGLAEYYDKILYPSGVVKASGPHDLPRYFKEIHTMALQNRLSWVLATSPNLSGELRVRRRTERLEAIRGAVKVLDAPKRETEDATAMLLSLSGADASWPMHDLYGLPLQRIPGVIANMVQLIVDQLQSVAR